jgi:hypothetical protein
MPGYSRFSRAAMSGVVLIDWLHQQPEVRQDREPSLTRAPARSSRTPGRQFTPTLILCVATLSSMIGASIADSSA